MKKYLCVLNWSHFFVFFILTCIANVMLGILLPRYQVNGNYFIVLFIYVIATVNCVLGYDRFYQPGHGIKVLETTPVNIEKVIRLYKISKLIMIFIPAIVGSLILLMNNSNMGWFIIPNSLIMLGFDYFIIRSVKRKEIKEDEAPIVIFLVCEMIITLIYVIEYCILMYGL